MKIAILTSPNQWFEKYAESLSEKLGKVSVFKSYEELNECFDILFILSYHQIIPANILKNNKHNIVIHASDLPSGKGWAPLFWQVLEGKQNITFSMFEAGAGVDDGDVFMKKTLSLLGSELNTELRRKQAELTIEMCVEFIEKYDSFLPPKKQCGDESFFPKRTSKDSELDVNKTIKEQFNLLRIVDNSEYPAFFYMHGKKYLIRIDEGA